MRVIVALLVLLCSPAFAQETGRVHGRIWGRTLSVFDSTALQGTEVLLVRGDSIISGTTSVYSDGAFVLEGVLPGNYVLRPRYIGFEQTDTSVSISGAQSLRVDLYVGRIIPDDELLFGAVEARRDIAAGRVALLRFMEVSNDPYDYPFPDSCFEGSRVLYDRRTAEIDRSFSYAVRDISEAYRDQNWWVVGASVDRYNEEVRRYLNERNGEGWWERRRAEVIEASRAAIREGCLN